MGGGLTTLVDVPAANAVVSCNIPVITSPFGIGLGVATPPSPTNSGPYTVSACYSGPTGPTAKVSVGAGASNGSPTNVYVSEQFEGTGGGPNGTFFQYVGLSPSYTVTPAGPGETGATITVSLPYQICVGDGNCVQSTVPVSSTGTIIGTLAPAPGPVGSVGAGYRLTKLEVRANGLTILNSDVVLGGVFVDDNDPLTLPAVGGAPCILGTICVGPTGSFGLNGSDPQITVTVPVLGTTITQAVPLPTQCIIGFSGPC